MADVEVKVTNAKDGNVHRMVESFVEALKGNGHKVTVHEDDAPHAYAAPGAYAPGDGRG